MDPDVMAMLQKSISAKVISWDAHQLMLSSPNQLCPTVIGQACMDVVVNPPREGDPSFSSWKSQVWLVTWHFTPKMLQVDGVLASLAERAKLVADTLNSIEGITCNTVQGAMYAFPQIHLPEKAIAAAKEAGMAADAFYAFALLEATGICIIPGSGFGQRPGTFHFRTTILAQKDVIKSMLGRWTPHMCVFVDLTGLEKP